MNKKGFTLIELLAVIVILAIIALIATPIVLNIITETRDSANLRSAEFYLDAVEQGILRSELKNKRVGDGEYAINNKGELCLITTPSECITLEIDGKRPSVGSTIKIENGNIKDVSLNLNDKVIVKNDNGEVIYFPCKLISGEENTIGSKYECEVKPGTKHNFYVLNYNHESGETNQTKENAVTTNLIMEQNICEDGSYATSSNTCLVTWYKDDSNSTSSGPVNAMNYLYNATSNWSNIPNIVMNYVDELNEYGGIKTEGNITTITKTDETITATYINLKAKLPEYIPLYNSNNVYLYDFLTNQGYYQSNRDLKNPIIGIRGYWLNRPGPCCADSCVEYVGAWECNEGIDRVGIRPVITIKL